MMIGHISFLRMLTLMLAVSVLFSIFPQPAWAQAQTGTTPAPTCTNEQGFDIQYPSPGLISTIVIQVKGTLSAVSGKMVNGITSDSGFRVAIAALVTIYIAVYGILFTFGMVQITLYDFAIRMVKIGIMALMLNGGLWNWIQQILIPFFNDGTDELIGWVITIATQEQLPSGDPFAALDFALANALSAKMWVTIMAVFTTGPMGVLFGLLILMAMGSFLKSLLNALWVYLMSLVLKTLLFGLTPIFISFLLFSRTRHLFDGWLNQLINASLQPVFLFTFFSFFVILITACLNNMTLVPVCWTEWAESLRGTPLSEHFWRFTRWNSTTQAFEPFDGMWTFSGAQGASGGPIFPIDIMTVLTFLILSELAGRFNHIVIEIAKDISGAVTSLGGMEGSISDWFTSIGGQRIAGNSPLGGGGVPTSPASFRGPPIQPAPGVTGEGLASNLPKGGSKSQEIRDQIAGMSDKRDKTTLG